MFGCSEGRPCRSVTICPSGCPPAMLERSGERRVVTTQRWVSAPAKVVVRVILYDGEGVLRSQQQERQVAQDLRPRRRARAQALDCVLSARVGRLVGAMVAEVAAAALPRIKIQLDSVWRIGMAGRAAFDGSAMKGAMEARAFAQTTQDAHQDAAAQTQAMEEMAKKTIMQASGPSLANAPSAAAPKKDSSDGTSNGEDEDEDSSPRRSRSPSRRSTSRALRSPPPGNSKRSYKPTVRASVVSERAARHGGRFQLQCEVRAGHRQHAFRRRGCVGASSPLLFVVSDDSVVQDEAPRLESHVEALRHHSAHLQGLLQGGHLDGARRAKDDPDGRRAVAAGRVAGCATACSTHEAPSASVGAGAAAARDGAHPPPRLQELGVGGDAGPGPDEADPAPFRHLAARRGAFAAASATGAAPERTQGVLDHRFAPRAAPFSSAPAEGAPRQRRGMPQPDASASGGRLVVEHRQPAFTEAFGGTNHGASSLEDAQRPAGEHRRPCIMGLRPRATPCWHMRRTHR